jgi:hypothetical protein
VLLPYARQWYTAYIQMYQTKFQSSQTSHPSNERKFYMMKMTIMNIKWLKSAVEKISQE